MKLIVGLGNPGRDYKNTRHNLGFVAVDYLLKEWAGRLRVKKKLSAAVWLNQARQTVVAQPLVFMGQSGLAVAKLARFYKIAPENVWLLHDDADLPLGKLRIVRNRGSAGHRGVESVFKHLKTRQMARFRLGIGHSHAGYQREGGKKVSKFDTQEEMENFILGRFSSKERNEVKKLVKKTAQAVELALEKDLLAAMNRFN